MMKREKMFKGNKYGKAEGKLINFPSALIRIAGDK